jgi:glycosyltransferase involved in cell wall biosynthesis
MHILLISSGQPSANPRLIKEALTYADAGYRVSVVYCPLSQWADVHDLELFNRYPSIKWICAGYHPVRNRFFYLFCRLRQKLYDFLFKVGFQHSFVAVRSMGLFTQELQSTAERIKSDICIGHNLNALPAVIAAAEKSGVPAVFDFEDFHRGEDTQNSLHWRKVKIVEDHYVPKLLYATSASSLIQYAYSELYPSLKIKTINNCFPLRYAQKEIKQVKSGVLKLFWFSQFVGKKRGLETVIEAIGLTGNRGVSLTLLGNCSENMRKYFEEVAHSNGLNKSQLQILPPVAESDISQIAKEHNLGLACEVPHVLNRELCLTNKIFFYLLTGNAILFTDTKAQLSFFTDYPEIGSIYHHNDAKQLAFILSQYLQDPGKLEKQQASALMLGKQRFNWEIEQEQLLQLISSI